VRLFVTGAAGMVGSYVSEAFAGAHRIETGESPGRVPVDIRDEEAVGAAVEAACPDAVLHLAALTDVDYCETHPDEAYATNALGTRNIALACRKRDIPLLYLSTSVVFAGTPGRPYAEDDVLAPVNVHGRTKLAGERFVAELVRRHVIARTTWVMGGGTRDKKFVGVMARKIAAGQSPLRAVTDKIGSPTYAKDLLRAMRELLNLECFGVYHIVNGGGCSRFELAVQLRNMMQRPEVVIEPASSSNFPLAAPRADYEVLDISKIESAGIHMRSWQDALREYYEQELGPSLRAHR
jgi:dTDP-4-dehydrorhamnose reductase